MVAIVAGNGLGLLNTSLNIIGEAGVLGQSVLGQANGRVFVNAVTGNHFGGSLGMIPVIGQLGYIALTAFAINALIAAVVTVALDITKVPHGRDETTRTDYLADEGDPRAEKRIEHTLPSI